MALRATVQLHLGWMHVPCTTTGFDLWDQMTSPCQSFA